MGYKMNKSYEEIGETIGLWFIELGTGILYTAIFLILMKFGLWFAGWLGLI
ncbi:hypothetical protein LCGC14_0986970 [marine sediment metagenome]|uniref:Uncharacterized protein n=1 Tax=marine sediment metagenome TaxID=412755 RepID=A0A0F9QQC9_9ZZZZ